MDCSICFYDIDKKDAAYKWTCNHTFHHNCIKNWNKSCPLCRCNEIKNTQKKYTNECFDIENYISFSDKISYNTINYKNKWKSKNCIESNHNIIYYNNYKPTGICHDCSIVQCFNYEPN